MINWAILKPQGYRLPWISTSPFISLFRILIKIFSWKLRHFTIKLLLIFFTILQQYLVFIVFIASKEKLFKNVILRFFPDLTLANH